MGSAYQGNLFAGQSQGYDCCEALGDDPMGVDDVKFVTAQKLYQSPKLSQQEKGNQQIIKRIGFEPAHNPAAMGGQVFQKPKKISKPLYTHPGHDFFIHCPG